MSFRIANRADAPQVAALVERAYRGESSRAGWTTEADLLDGQRTDADAVAALIDASDSVVLVADEGAAIVACAHLVRDGDAAWFGMFAVEPRRQGNGTGAALLAHAEALAVARFASTTMKLGVIWTRAELIAWYARRGYRDSGATKPFPYGDPHYGLPKREDLHFRLFEKPLAR